MKFNRNKNTSKRLINDKKSINAENITAPTQERPIKKNQTGSFSHQSIPEHLSFHRIMLRIINQNYPKLNIDILKTLDFIKSEIQEKKYKEFEFERNLIYHQFKSLFPHNYGIIDLVILGIILKANLCLDLESFDYLNRLFKTYDNNVTYVIRENWYRADDIPINSIDEFCVKDIAKALLQHLKYLLDSKIIVPFFISNSDLPYSDYINLIKFRMPKNDIKNHDSNNVDLNHNIQKINSNASDVRDQKDDGDVQRVYETKEIKSFIVKNILLDSNKSIKSALDFDCLYGCIKLEDFRYYKYSNRNNL